MGFPEIAGIGIILYGLIILFMSSLGFIVLAFWIWMLVECLTKESSEGNDKLIWAIVIIFTNWIGALIYFFVRRPERKRLQKLSLPQ